MLNQQHTEKAWIKPAVIPKKEVTLQEIMGGDWPKAEEWTPRLMREYARFIADTKEPEVLQKISMVLVARIPKEVFASIDALAKQIKARRLERLNRAKEG